MAASFEELKITLDADSGKPAQVVSVGTVHTHEYVFSLIPKPASTFRAHFLSLVAKEGLGEAWVDVNEDEDEDEARLTLTCAPGSLTKDVC